MEEKIEEKQEQKAIKKILEYKLVQIPTQHTLAIQTPSGDVLNMEESQVLILNQLMELNKRL